MFGVNGNPIILSGNSNPVLALKICEYLDLEICKAEVFKFNNDNTFVKILENVRQKDVFIVQSTSTPVNDHIMEMLIMIDAAKRASAGRITAVIPYYSYARTDKKDQPRVPITGRLIADLLETAGTDRILMMDLHAGQVQGFFRVPVDELTAMHLLVDYFDAKSITNPVVVATDIGISKKARDFALKMNAPLAIIEKRRVGNRDKVESLNIIGDVKGTQAILFDDEINTGESMVSGAKILSEFGVDKIYAVATHGILPGETINKLSKVDNIEEFVITDTVPFNSDKFVNKFKILSIAPLFGEAIKRIHEGQSVGALFAR